MRISRKKAGNPGGRHVAASTTCRVLNVFGSLAVAGVLTWGGAGMAQAADWDTSPVIIDSTDSFTKEKDPATDKGYTNEGMQNIEATSVRVTQGGDLTVTGRLSHYKGQGGTTPYDGMDFVMDGGSLRIQNAGSLASIDANTVTISGGTITLTGGTDPASAYIGGYQGLQITGGEIQMNDNSQLFAGSDSGFSFTGGTVTLNGAAGEDAHIMFSDTGSNTIGGSAVINVTGAGKFSIQDTTKALDLKMTGGALNIAETGTLTLGGGTQADKLTQSGGTVTNAGELQLADKASMTVEDGGLLRNEGTGQINLGTSSALTFDNGSTFDVSAAGGQPAITGAGGVTVNDGARLRISGAKAGEEYTLVGGTVSITQSGTEQNGWSGDNLLSSTSFLDLSLDPATGKVTPAARSAAEALPTLDGELGLIAQGMYAAARNDYFAVEPGRRFLSRATDSNYVADATQAAVTIESAARMALLGAVPQMTLAANNAAGNAVTQRTSLAQPGGNAIQSMASDGSVSGASATEVAKTGFALWIMPLYQSANGWGLEGGNFNMDYSGGLGGVAIGADYTFENAIRAGITFNIGGGYATGSGDFNETTNDMSFWGIGAYAGWTKNNFGLTADVNYTSTYNKLEQELPAAMQMDSLKSDVTAYAISAGLRGEYKFETSVLDITP
uniref:autotransporter outer membrane beta-barrel domain-containing protein n=1 Tax=Desulfovibrio sp. ZJ369 TaxID=2709793 RepID=UPI0013EDB96F